MLKMHFLKTNNFYQRVATSLFLLPFFVYCFVYMPFLFCAVLIFCLMFILVYEWPVLCPISHAYFFLKTFFYPIIPFLSLVFLYLFFRTKLALLWAYVCCFDTACYVIGNFVGTTSITQISPKKTWEGLIGGIIICQLIFLFVHRYVFCELIGYEFFIFYFLVSVAAFCGDLFESWLKRNAGIKNSGTILPGHGGLLDRFDSILFVAVVYILYEIMH